MDDASEISQGKSLCRLGYPFPEFYNYKYIKESDNIFFTDDPFRVPSFPIDGIVTREVADEIEEIFAIELSTPGLKGQSGGPLFDTEGRICGMQFETHHLHLGFDIQNESIRVNGEIKSITNQPFLHVGHCIHVNVVKSFLDENGIEYHTN